MTAKDAINPVDSKAALTREEIHMVSIILKKLPKGYLPFEVFRAVAEKVTTPTMEVAPVRRSVATGSLEILLTQRAVNDPYWPSAWHIPGTVIRSTDEEGSFMTGFERVLRDELHGVVRPTSELILVGVKFWDVARGRELDHVHYFETDVANDALIEGTFFDTNSLPQGVLDHHRIMIADIAASFRSNDLKNTKP